MRVEEEKVNLDNLEGKENVGKNAGGGNIRLQCRW